MAENTVQGLFGLSPQEINAQRQNKLFSQADSLYGGGDTISRPFDIANRQIYQGAGMLAGPLASMMGMKDPAIEQQAQMQQQMAGVDLSNPDSIRLKAKEFNDRGDTKTALQLQQVANMREEEQIKQEFQNAQTEHLRKDVQTFKAGVPGKPGWEMTYDSVTKQPIPGTEQPMFDPNRNGGSGGMRDTDYLKWMNQHDKDYTKAQSAMDGADDGQKNVKDIITNPNFKYMFGGYTEKALSRFSSGELAGLNNSIDTLKNQLMIQGLDKVRNGGGVGSMTEKEWPIMRDMISSLDPKMDEATAKASLAKIYDYFERAKKESSTNYENKWNNKRGQEFYRSDLKERYSQEQENNKKTYSNGWSAKIVK